MDNKDYLEAIGYLGRTNHNAVLAEVTRRRAQQENCDALLYAAVYLSDTQVVLAIVDAAVTNAKMITRIGVDDAAKLLESNEAHSLIEAEIGMLLLEAEPAFFARPRLERFVQGVMKQIWPGADIEGAWHEIERIGRIKPFIGKTYEEHYKKMVDPANPSSRFSAPLKALLEQEHLWITHPRYMAFMDAAEKLDTIPRFETHIATSFKELGGIQTSQNRAIASLGSP
jgi:hypothetical protein